MIFASGENVYSGEVVHSPCENSRLSDDLDAIVKSLALNSCKENSSF